MKTSHRTFRAMKKLVEEGFPQEAFFVLTLKTDAELFYLGSICLSRDEKIIFFPGVKHNTIEKEFTGTYMGKQIDHLTLERNLKRWHVTLAGKDYIKPNPRTRPIGDGLLYWFSFNFKTLTSLPQFLKQGSTYSITDIFTSIPSTHSQQREAFLKQSLNAGRTEILTPKVITGCPVQQIGKYFHFSFLVDTNPDKEKKINFAKPPLQCEKTELVSSHRIEIKEHLDLVIVCAYLPGELPHSVLYNWWPNP